MGLMLSSEDQYIVGKLHSEGVLKEVHAGKMQAPNGFMAFLCSDCDHIQDKFTFLCEVCEKQSGSKRVHLFAQHSGGMLLSPTSPTKKRRNEHVIYVEHIADAMMEDMKGMTLLISKCHAPCGAAYLKGLNFYEVLRHTFEGKSYAKKKLKALRVAVFAQIHYPDGRKRTYSVEGKDWWAYAKRHNLFE
jgi:hypothetical protein